MIYKRGSVYWYEFVWRGKRIRESTHQGNDRVAQNMENERRVTLIREQRETEDAVKKLGCRASDLLRCTYCEKLFNGTLGVSGGDKKFCDVVCRKEWTKRHRQIPTLREFIEKRFQPWAKTTFELERHKSWLWYRTETRAIQGYEPLANARLDEISSETISGFTAHRKARGCKVATVNSGLRVLRSVLNRAAEWGALDKVAVMF